jgi:hypothetical protein
VQELPPQGGLETKHEQPPRSDKPAEHKHGGA